MLHISLILFVLAQCIRWGCTSVYLREVTVLNQDHKWKTESRHPVEQRTKEQLSTYFSCYFPFSPRNWQGVSLLNGHSWVKISRNKVNAVIVDVLQYSFTIAKFNSLNISIFKQLLQGKDPKSPGSIKTHLQLILHNWPIFSFNSLFI